MAVLRVKAVGGSTKDIPSANLVAHWEFENNLLDSSPNGYDLSQIGSISFIDGIKGIAMQNDNDNSGARIASALGNVFLGTSAFTVGIWMKLSDFGDNERAEIFKVSNNVTGDSTVSIFVQPDGASFKRENSAGEEEIKGNVSQALDEWYFYTVTYDGSTMKIYVNGELDNSILSSRSTTASGYVWLPLINVPNAPILQLDEAFIYSEALSAADIKDIYNYIGFSWQRVN